MSSFGSDARFAILLFFGAIIVLIVGLALGAVGLWALMHLAAFLKALG